MSTTYALRDSATMLRRDLRHLQRYPGLSLFPILTPVILLLVFVYVFGGSFGCSTGAAVAFTSSKIAIFCSTPFSSSVKSSFFRPAMCSPERSLTTAGTSTSRKLNTPVSSIGDPAVCTANRWKTFKEMAP